MCVHSSLNQIYWSDIEHGVSSVISKTCVYIHCMVDHYVRTNDECTQVCYCSYYLNVVSHITMSDLMMDVHTYVTDTTTYTMLCQISRVVLSVTHVCNLSLNKTCWSDIQHGVISVNINTCVYIHQ
jgi:hypothetical protein